MFGNLGGGEVLLIAVYCFIFIIPFWQILKKAGFNPLISLIAIVPIVNLIALYVFAFSRWPVQNK